MPVGDGHHRSRMTLAGRVKLWRAGLMSSVKRYGRDLPPPGLVPAVGHAAMMKALHHLPLAQRWVETPSRAGVSAISWLGHCTVLMKINGMTILTDPVLASKIGLKLGFMTIGPRRLAPVPVLAHALPPADLVLLSHAHFDHLDLPTLRGLVNKQTRVVTATKTARLIPGGFGRVDELAWDQELEVGGVRLRAIRPRHWGARKAWDHHRGYNGYLIESLTKIDSESASRVLFAGDTAYTENFDQVGPVDLAVFGIGAYNPWHHAHATPEQVWQMATRISARQILPVHHSTFKLSDEPIDEPMQRLLAAAGDAASRVLHAPVGDVLHLEEG